MNALIIGGSTGIGAATINLMNSKNIATTSINRSGNTNATVSIQCDILNDELPDLDDKPDAIIYFPGTINLKPFRTIKPEEFKNDWEINFLGAIKVIQKYAPLLSASENASIVLFSTVAVQTGMPFHTSIAAAKGAIEGLTRSLAAEFAPKIRVNCIAPSLTDTPLANRLIENEIKLKSAEDRHPLKKIGNPDDFASMVHWLISENAKFMTGQVITIDGGIGTLASGR
ncbi:MAG TPA: SDR family oxidoreductase [Bacteroidia bacterium]|jgi:NAD(P)-dependent dehydrogenase (short-subunit alcohol dehydrogenase family)|nr:SDR family oxidoreductase [Bacteroidia bacterium]HQW23738.1 SDR family oxidoreductase [Bacteroidia bacterium]